MSGWVKLWRKSIDGGLIKNHNAWILWTYCLMKANHKEDYKQVVGFQEVILQPGQFIFGRKKAALETRLSEQKIRTCLSFLKKYGNLTIKSTNKFSIITITNWATYQDKDKEDNQQTNQHVTSRQPASNHKQEQKNKRTKEVLNKEILKEKIIQHNMIETKDKIFEFFTYRMNMAASKRYKTEKGLNALFRDLTGCRENGLILTECLDEAMEREWLTPKPDYFKNNNNPIAIKDPRLDFNKSECIKFAKGGNDGW